MELPPRVTKPRRNAAEGSGSAEAAPKLRYKLATVVDRNEKVKMAYNQLQSQIAFSLVEAGEVFESLAVPLTKLVGLKTSEMEREGRRSTFICSAERYHMNTSQNGTRSDDLNNQIRSPKGDNYAAKVVLAGKEIIHKHKGQLRQLVHMLKHVETQVNSHQDDILQMIDDRRTFFQNFFRKALYGLSSVHSQNRDTLPVTMKLLKMLFNNINELLGSVDNGVSDLMLSLANNMCSPMSKYAGSLAAEIKRGPCVQLMNVVNEMEKQNTDTRRELEDARERIIFAEERFRLAEERFRVAEENARRAEETKIDALLRLKRAEDQNQRMAKTSRFLLPASQQKQAEPSITGKRLGIEGGRESEDKFLWDLLSKKRKLQEPESPMGPKELIRQAEAKQKPFVCNRRMTRSQTRLSSTLGVSPSASTGNWR